MTTFGIIMIIVASSVAVFFILLFAIGITHRVYQSFALKHSVTIKRLQEALPRYKFKAVENPILENSYDDKNHYKAISPQDYLIYCIVNDVNSIRSQFKNTDWNNKQLKALITEMATGSEFGTYDIAPKGKWLWLLKRIEKKVYDRLFPKPALYFFVTVRLFFQDKNVYLNTQKAKVFPIYELEEIYRRTKRKRGSYYLDQGIWDALCRVERGKVGWSVRKAIFTRDNCECQKCHCRFPVSKLEVDHIIPVSKGGKSTMDNLQTLCHDCNYKKGSAIE